MNDPKRKAFLIISPREDRLTLLSQWVSNHYSRPTIYPALNGSVAFNMAKNANVDIVITETDEKRIHGVQAVESILREKVNTKIAAIIIGQPPETETFIDEMVTGQVQFLAGDVGEDEFSHSLAAALNYSAQTVPTTFHLKFLAQGDLLIREGDKAEHIYILKNGELSAYLMRDGEKKVLGSVGIGEFVGEMALINNETRSANIEAVTDSELIEMPVGLVSKMIYTKPSWARALMQALSKRLKGVNKMVTTKD